MVDLILTHWLFASIFTGVALIAVWLGFELWRAPLVDDDKFYGES